MSFRSYIILMSCMTALAWGAIGVVIALVNPFAAGAVGLFLFYASVFLATAGALALLGIGVRVKLFGEEPQFVRVSIAFRQGVWFGLLVIGSLALAHAAWLTWWTLASFIALLTVLEAIVVSFGRSR